MDRLANGLPHLISKEPKGFVHGRGIKDCICLTLEEANMIQQKSIGGHSQGF